MRFFSYVWPEDLSTAGQRTRVTSDSVARELGDQVYRNNITHKIYKDMYKDNPRCLIYNKWEEVRSP